jgi:RNA polymerase sigma-70 factor, ECF subfamily
MSHDQTTWTVTNTSARQSLQRAENPDSGVLHGRFRRARQLQDDPERERQVSLAVLRARQGDREALRYLYVQYADNVYGYVTSLLRDEHDAEDVTQQVFAKLMTVIGKYEPRAVPFSAWILRVARNVAVDHLRSRRPQPSEEVYGADERSDDTSIDRSYSVREALAALPDEQRKVVVLRHVVGLTPGEIASCMGRSESSIHGLHHRGRRALQEEFASRESAPSTAMLKVAA